MAWRYLIKCQMCGAVDRSRETIEKPSPRLGVVGNVLHECGNGRKGIGMIIGYEEDKAAELKGKTED